MRIRMVIFIILIGCLAFGSRANATQLVVIASNTKQFTTGEIIEASKEISLPADASITLISSDGGSIKLNGPYKGKPNTASSTENNSLIETLSKIASKENATGLAVFRSTAASQPDLWAIRINKGVTQCVRGDEKVVLWNNRIRSDSKLQIKPLSDPSKTVSLNWPGGERVVEWPSSLSLKDGESYETQFAGSNKKTQIRIRVIPKNQTTNAHRAAWAWEHGCDKQAKRVVRELAKGN